MKTVLKEGKKEFIGRCRHCGCEFKYELEDISFGSVQCPFCYNFVAHKDQIVDIDDDIVRDSLGNPVWQYPYPINVPSIGKDVWYSCQTVNKVESE